MQQSDIDVRHVANLARLELNDDEVAVFQPQLEAIIERARSLMQLNVANIEPTAHPSPIFGRMRNDEPHESLSPAAVLQNAPDQAQSQIRVPKVVTDA